MILTNMKVTRMKKTPMTKNIKNANKQTNVKLYILSALVFLMFAGMCTFLVYFNMTNQSEFFNNSYNTRQEMMAQKYIRGSIYSSDGKTLAQTIVQEDKSEKREYPYGELFCHVVGYEGYGKSGIEGLANYELSHANASLNSMVSSAMADIKLPADNVYTTFDTKLQEVADRAMGVYQGAVVVTEVKTGRILAMVSKPGFDPNDVNALFNQLTDDEESTVLLNRATQGLYPPGSIFKIVTTLEYLREHDNDLSKYHFNCPGEFVLDKIKVSCFNHKAHGYETYEDSVTNSCNSSFANIGVGLDLDKYADTLNNLFFNEKLPIDLPSSISSFDLVGDGTKDAIIQSSFGQGKTIVTPLQMNMITCGIANYGDVMKPQLIKQIRATDGTVVKTYQPKTYKTIMTEEESKILTDLMIKVVEDGTASKLSGLSYTVAGKTGSAEYDSSKIYSHSWFTGFAPAENPEIAVTVIMEEAGTGSAYAVPAAKRIFDAYFDVD